MRSNERKTWSDIFLSKQNINVTLFLSKQNINVTLFLSKQNINVTLFLSKQNINVLMFCLDNNFLFVQADNGDFFVVYVSIVEKGGD